MPLPTLIFLVLGASTAIYIRSAVPRYTVVPQTDGAGTQVSVDVIALADGVVGCLVDPGTYWS